jgi:hypothetical protein
MNCITPEIISAIGVHIVVPICIASTIIGVMWALCRS